MAETVAIHHDEPGQRGSKGRSSAEYSRAHYGRINNTIDPGLKREFDKGLRLTQIYNKNRIIKG